MSLDTPEVLEISLTLISFFAHMTSLQRLKFILSYLLYIFSKLISKYLDSVVINAFTWANKVVGSLH